MSYKEDIDKALRGGRLPITPESTTAQSVPAVPAVPAQSAQSAQKLTETKTPTPPTPTTTHTPTTSVPTWSEITRDLNELDGVGEERRSEILKKQRAAKAIATLGDFATHALNVWGATTGGYSAPIQGAPLTTGVQARHKEMLDEHAKRLAAYKKQALATHEGKREDWKLRREAKLKEREAKLKDEQLKIQQQKDKRAEEKAERQAQMDQLKMQNYELKMRLAESKDEREKQRLKSQISVNNARIYDLYNGGGKSSIKKKYVVDGIEYNDIYDAYLALPEEEQTGGILGNPSRLDMERAIKNHKPKALMNTMAGNDEVIDWTPDN